jgi:hypothetical protein
MTVTGRGRPVPSSTHRLMLGVTVVACVGGVGFLTGRARRLEPGRVDRAVCAAVARMRHRAVPVAVTRTITVAGAPAVAVLGCPCQTTPCPAGGSAQGPRGVAAFVEAPRFPTTVSTAASWRMSRGANGRAARSGAGSRCAARRLAASAGREQLASGP